MIIYLYKLVLKLSLGIILRVFISEVNWNTYIHLGIKVNTYKVNCMF